MSERLDWRIVTLVRAGGEPVSWPVLPTDTPGLVVHHSMGDPGWVVTHERSGLFVCGADYRGEAMALAAALGAAGDWTRSGTEIKADAAMAAKTREIRGSMTWQPNDHPSRGYWEAR